MRRVLFGLALFAVSACTSRSVRPPLNHEQTVTTGNALIEWRTSGGFPRTHMIQRLIYLGSTGDVLRVGYREETSAGTAFNMYARPAFSNELTYDTSKSKTVRYEDFALEVKEFDSSHVTYEVTGVPGAFAEVAKRKE